MIEESLDLVPGSVKVVGWSKGWHATPVAAWKNVTADTRAQIDAACLALRRQYDLKR
jgi:hypothetical protein